MEQGIICRHGGMLHFGGAYSEASRIGLVSSHAKPVCQRSQPASAVSTRPARVEHRRNIVTLDAFGVSVG